MVRIRNCSTCFSSYFDKQNAISSMLNIEIKNISLQSSRIPTGLHGHLCSVRTGDTAQIRPRHGDSSSLAARQGSPERKEGNVLFNDALNTFYLRLYGVSHMVKDHSDSERGNLLPPHGLLFLINSNGFFYMHHPPHRIAHTTAFVTPVVEHWLERETAQ